MDHASFEETIRLDAHGPDLDVRDDAFALRRIYRKDPDWRHGGNDFGRRGCSRFLGLGSLVPDWHAQHRRNNAGARKAIRGGRYEGSPDGLIVIFQCDEALD